MPRNKIIVVSRVNDAGALAKRVNEELALLGEGWKILSAATTTTIFGIEKKGGDHEESVPPVHNAIYTTTVALEKPD